MRILKLPDVTDKTGLRRSAIYARMAQGVFPQQIKIGPKGVGWLESEVDAWIADLVRRRDEGRA